MVTIGRYKIVRRLAIGGMAEVFLAKVAGPGGFEKLVVLKRILPQLADSEMYVKMFLEEARVAAQLDHPNIVHVFDFGEIDGTYFLTMEYVEGATLKQLARWGAQTEETRLPPHVIAYVASQVCAGLGYAHTFTAPETGELRPLVHRDVSPENIMVSRSGSVKLLDFGVAKSAIDDDRSVVGMLKGKISYMPPEQLEGAASVDHRVDLYALGVVMYHTLSGRRPYESETELGLIDAILKGQPVPLLKHRLDLSDDLLAIVDRAISRKPEERFQSCAELRRALDAYIVQGGKSTDASDLQSLVQRFLLEGGNRGHVPDKSASASPASVQMSGVELSVLELEMAEKSPAPDAPLNDLMAAAARSSPGVRGPFAAQARPPPPPRVGDDEPDTDPGLPQLEAVPTPRVQRRLDVVEGEPVSLPRPSISGVKMRRTQSLVAFPVTEAATAEAKVRRWTPTSVAAEPIRQALRDKVRADRSTHLLRKLPSIIARLCDAASDVPWAVGEALAGAIDAAALADEHDAIVALVERAESRPGKDKRFGRTVHAELTSPLRFAWLVERLRSGVADMSGLRAWLTRLGPTAAPLFLSAIEMSSPGPAQDLFAEGLSPAVAEDPSVALNRLREPKVETVAALCYALELVRAEARSEVFDRLFLHGDTAMRVEALSGVARAQGASALQTLEGFVRPGPEAVRRRAVQLIGQLCGRKGFELLLARSRAADFETLPLDDRAGVWAAMLECGADDGVAEVSLALESKGSLLNKRRLTDTKLGIVEGLSRARTEPARALLEEASREVDHGTQVVSAAKVALGTRVASGAEPESRQRLVARLCLDLALLARATTTVDLGSGLLDPGLEHLRDAVRQVWRRDGQLDLTVTAEGPLVNGAAVSFGAFHKAAAPLWERALKARDLKSLTVESEAAIAMRGLRSFLYRAFDPEGRHEVLDGLRALTFAGDRLLPMKAPSTAVDSGQRTEEIFSYLTGWLNGERAAVKAGRAPDLAAADAALDEWAHLVDRGESGLLGMARPGSDRGAAHALSTAALCMAFAHDLGLQRSALREVAELAVLSSLAQATDASDNHALRTAGLAITHRLNRLGTAVAVAAVESSLVPDKHHASLSVLASIHALAQTYDALTAGVRAASAPALEAMNGKLRSRFSAELLGLFTQWAFAQS